MSNLPKKEELVRSIVQGAGVLQGMNAADLMRIPTNWLEDADREVWAAVNSIDDELIQREINTPGGLD